MDKKTKIRIEILEKLNLLTIVGLIIIALQQETKTMSTIIILIITILLLIQAKQISIMNKIEVKEDG